MRGAVQVAAQALLALLSLQGSLAFQSGSVLTPRIRGHNAAAFVALKAPRPFARAPQRPLALEMGLGFGKQAQSKGAKNGLQVMSKQGPTRTVPDHIMKPDYAQDGQPKARGLLMPWDIPVNSAEDIAGIRKAARAAREVLDIAGAAVKLGMTTDEIDAIVHEETIKRGGYPSPLNYNGFPKSVCTSINEVVCHGIPCTVTKLKDGDTINIDVTVFLDGYHGDCSEMFTVGEVDDSGRKLIETTYKALAAPRNPATRDLPQPGRASASPRGAAAGLTLGAGRRRPGRRASRSASRGSPTARSAARWRPWCKRRV
jgi:hypothetical protein